jgi:hypothetical protein
MLSPAIMLYEETFHTIFEQAKPAGDHDSIYSNIWKATGT